MGYFSIFTTRLAALLMLHAAGAGLASPTVVVTRPLARVVEWLPVDNQTLYTLDEGEKRTLELNTSALTQRLAYITISPCCRDFHWAMYQKVNGHLSLTMEHTGLEMTVFSVILSNDSRYVLQLSSLRGGAAVVSVRGEASRTVRMRLRVRSRRRLTANWEPSPIDPQSTTYCVVASHRKNYTSLCAAQMDVKTNRNDKPNRYSLDRFDNSTSLESIEVDNKIDADFNIYEGDFRSVYRRRKFGRSTKATDEDPVIACVGDRTHHVIENLDPTLTYFVSVFGVAKDRRAGSLLATGSVKPKTSTAKRLRENVSYRADVRGKTVYYFKATLGSGGGVWMTVSTCGGAVDLEVLVRGKRLHMAKNIEPHTKFFIPAPVPTSSIQETSDEGSVQFDSSSEETKIRYVIRVTPSRVDGDAVGVELTASTSRWGINTPELLEDGSVVRELRPRRSCRSLDIAFLPAIHNATDSIRYCITAKENTNTENYACGSSRKSSAKTQCINHLQRPLARVIVQKISGLKPGKKYAIQVTASNKGSSVPYQVLFADTNTSCKDDGIVLSHYIPQRGIKKYAAAFRQDLLPR